MLTVPALGLLKTFFILVADYIYKAADEIPGLRNVSDDILSHVTNTANRRRRSSHVIHKQPASGCEPAIKSRDSGAQPISVVTPMCYDVDVDYRVAYKSVTRCRHVRAS